MWPKQFRRFGVLLVTVAAGAALLGGARPASACGMFEGRRYFMPERSPDQLLLAAAGAARAGRLGRAYGLARQVTSNSRASGDARARGFALAGWIEWQRGARARALTSFDRARILGNGREAIDRVLAQAAPSRSLLDLKHALAG